MRPPSLHLPPNSYCCPDEVDWSSCGGFDIIYSHPQNVSKSPHYNDIPLHCVVLTFRSEMTLSIGSLCFLRAAAAATFDGLAGELGGLTGFSSVAGLIL